MSLTWDFRPALGTARTICRLGWDVLLSRFRTRVVGRKRSVIPWCWRAGVKVPTNIGEEYSPFGSSSAAGDLYTFAQTAAFTRRCCRWGWYKERSGIFLPSEESFGHVVSSPPLLWWVRYHCCSQLVSPRSSQFDAGWFRPPAASVPS